MRRGRAGERRESEERRRDERGEQAWCVCQGSCTHGRQGARAKELPRTSSPARTDGESARRPSGEEVRLAISSPKALAAVRQCCGSWPSQFARRAAYPVGLQRGGEGDVGGGESPRAAGRPGGLDERGDARTDSSERCARAHRALRKAGGVQSASECMRRRRAASEVGRVRRPPPLSFVPGHASDCLAPGTALLDKPAAGRRRSPSSRPRAPDTSSEGGRRSSSSCNEGRHACSANQASTLLPSCSTHRAAHQGGGQCARWRSSLCPPLARPLSPSDGQRCALLVVQLAIAAGATGTRVSAAPPPFSRERAVRKRAPLWAPPRSRRFAQLASSSSSLPPSFSPPRHQLYPPPRARRAGLSLRARRSAPLPPPARRAPSASPVRRPFARSSPR